MNEPIADAAAEATRDASTLAAFGDALVSALTGRIAFDRLNIGLIDRAGAVFHDAYVHGRNVAGRATGHLRPLAGTVVEAADRAGDGFCYGSDDRASWLDRFPHFGPVFDSGIRAMLAVPLRQNGVLCAALVLASRDALAYGEEELRRAILVGRSIGQRIMALRSGWAAGLAADITPSGDTRPNAMHVDLDAIDANVALVRGLAPGKAIIASVKANAYGHGIVPVARRLSDPGIEVLATGSFTDALAMRDAGIDTPILMMGGALPSAVPELVRHGLMPTVHCQELADAAASGPAPRARIYIKVDCGFGRLGVPLRDAHRFVMAVARMPRIEIAGLYTHLPFSDAVGREWARERIARFDELVAALARDGLDVPVTQARASAALLTGITDRCTAVSPGALLYGLAPTDPGLADLPGLRPVMASVRTRLIQISPFASDRTPGFEGRYASRVRSTTGVVPFGRVDGNRAPLQGSGAFMLVDGITAPILGVSLEHTVLDLSDVPAPVVGQHVVVLGESGHARITVENIAKWQGMGVNDVLMSLNGRVPQVFSAS
jgi:alanine racemase